MPKRQGPHVLVASRRHAGTHLINPLVKRLSGVKAVSLDKIPELYTPPAGQKLVVFTRDSRNIITARFRWKLRQQGISDAPTLKWDAEIAAKLLKRNGTDPKLPPQLWKLTGAQANQVYWRHYLGLPHHRVRFEDLTGKRYRKHLHSLATYLDSQENITAIWDGLYQKSHTYSGRFTDWEEWWGPLSRQAFKNTGGRELLKLLGYPYETL